MLRRTRERGDRYVDLDADAQPEQTIDSEATSTRSPLSPPPMTTRPDVSPEAERRREGETRTIVRERAIPQTARGGLSIGAVLTGVVVSLGSMMIFAAIGTAVAAAYHITDTTVRGRRVTAIAIAIAIGIVLAQYLSYLWGGYTAGRMARGSGALNGFLVPVVALLIAFGAGAISRALGVDMPTFNLAYGARFGIDQALTVGLGFGVGAASLLAMFAGGTAGGVRGAWWHDRLEAPMAADVMQAGTVTETIDTVRRDDVDTVRRDDDVVESASEDSFPGSDPPSYTGSVAGRRREAY